MKTALTKPNEKTELLKDLHRKAIFYLELIDKAVYKRNYWVELSVKLQTTTPGNELIIWPLGNVPTEEQIENGLAFARKVLQRVDHRYYDLLDKINAHSIDNIKT